MPKVDTRTEMRKDTPDDADGAGTARGKERLFPRKFGCAEETVGRFKMAIGGAFTIRDLAFLW